MTAVVPARCRCCGHALAPVLEVGQGFHLAACAACGLASTLPELSRSEMAAFYPPEYYGARNRRFIGLLEGWIPWFRSRRAVAIERFTARGRALDVGCGRGYLPAVLRDRGWDVHGTEMSEGAAAHARDVLGVPVHIGSLEDAPYADASFDAIVLWHVLEHLVDPRSALRKSHELLKPGGILVVAVPNYASLQARATGADWFHLDVPRHYHHFRLDVLRRLLDECDYDVLDVSHFVLEQNPFGWIQSLYNRLGFAQNLLYESLKDRSARKTPQHPARAHPVQAIAVGALLPLIASVSGALTLLELVARRGGTVEVYARPRARRADPAG